MGFTATKRQVIDCLNSGLFQHEVRDNIDVKNLLSTGEMSAQEVANILGRARGNGYSSSPHHYDKNVDVHIIETKYAGEQWYIKWYFSEPNSIFISVHN